MTMPHLMNCGHSETGWCLDCVKEQWEELDKSGDALAVATKALGWYAGMLRPEDRLNDNGDRATAALIVIMEKLK